MSGKGLVTSRGRWTVFSIFLLALGAAWTLRSRLPETDVNPLQRPPSPRQGFAAPDFNLDLLGGGQVRLADLRGSAVVVNFWASWCPPCRLEMPAIERVYRDYRDRGLVVLGVNSTSQDRESDAAAFVGEYGLTFPVPLDRDGAVSVKYTVNGLPTTFFIDREGIIRSVIVGGPMNEAVIRSKVEDLMGEAP